MTEEKRIPVKLGFGALLSLAAVLAVFAVGCPAAQSGSGNGNGDEPLDGIPIRVAIPEDYVIDPGKTVVVTVHLTDYAEYTDGQTILISHAIAQDPQQIAGNNSTRVLAAAIQADVTVDEGEMTATFPIQTNASYGQGIADGANASVRLELQAVDENDDPIGRKYFTSVTVHRPG